MLSDNSPVDESLKERWNRFDSLVSQQVSRLRTAPTASSSSPSLTSPELSPSSEEDSSVHTRTRSHDTRTRSNNTRTRSHVCSASARGRRDMEALTAGVWENTRRYVEHLKQNPFAGTPANEPVETPSCLDNSRGLPSMTRQVAPLLNLTVMHLETLQGINSDVTNGSVTFPKGKYLETERSLKSMRRRAATLEHQLRQFTKPVLVTSLSRRSSRAASEAGVMARLVDRLRKTSRKSAHEPSLRQKASDMSLKLKALLSRQKCEWQCVGRLKETLTIAREIRDLLQFLTDLTSLLQQEATVARWSQERPPPYDYVDKKDLLPDSPQDSPQHSVLSDSRSDVTSCDSVAMDTDDQSGDETNTRFSERNDATSYARDDNQYVCRGDTSCGQGLTSPPNGQDNHADSPGHSNRSSDGQPQDPTVTQPRNNMEVKRDSLKFPEDKMGTEETPKDNTKMRDEGIKDEKYKSQIGEEGNRNEESCHDVCDTGRGVNTGAECTLNQDLKSEQFSETETSNTTKQQTVNKSRSNSVIDLSYHKNEDTKQQVKLNNVATGDKCDGEDQPQHSLTEPEHSRCHDNLSRCQDDLSMSSSDTQDAISKSNQTTVQEATPQPVSTNQINQNGQQYNPSHQYNSCHQYNPCQQHQRYNLSIQKMLGIPQSEQTEGASQASDSGVYSGSVEKTEPKLKLVNVESSTSYLANMCDTSPIKYRGEDTGLKFLSPKVTELDLQCAFRNLKDTGRFRSKDTVCGDVSVASVIENVITVNNASIDNNPNDLKNGEIDLDFGNIPDTTTKISCKENPQLCRNAMSELQDLEVDKEFGDVYSITYRKLTQEGNTSVDSTLNNENGDHYKDEFDSTPEVNKETLAFRDDDFDSKHHLNSSDSWEKALGLYQSDSGPDSGNFYCSDTNPELANTLNAAIKEAIAATIGPSLSPKAVGDQSEESSVDEPCGYGDTQTDNLVREQLNKKYPTTSVHIDLGDVATAEQIADLAEATGPESVCSYTDMTSEMSGGFSKDEENNNNARVYQSRREVKGQGQPGSRRSDQGQRSDTSLQSGTDNSYQQIHRNLTAASKRDRASRFGSTDKPSTTEQTKRSTAANVTTGKTQSSNGDSLSLDLATESQENVRAKVNTYLHKKYSLSRASNSTVTNLMKKTSTSHNPDKNYSGSSLKTKSSRQNSCGAVTSPRNDVTRNATLGVSDVTRTPRGTNSNFSSNVLKGDDIFQVQGHTGHERLLCMRENYGLVTELPVECGCSREQLETFSSKESPLVGDLTTMPLVYCLPRTEGQLSPYDPYDLCVVSQDKAIINNIYFTVDALGITTCRRADQSEERTPALLWLRERKLFHAIHKLRVFLKFRLLKSFQAWKREVKNRKNRSNNHLSPDNTDEYDTHSWCSLPPRGRQDRWTKGNPRGLEHLQGSWSQTKTCEGCCPVSRPFNQPVSHRHPTVGPAVSPPWVTTTWVTCLLVGGVSAGLSHAFMLLYRQLNLDPPDEITDYFDTINPDLL